MAVLVITLSTTLGCVAGCGQEGGSPQTSEQQAATQDATLAEGLLSVRDLSGFNPAGDHDVFRDFRPTDRDCRALFTSADRGGSHPGARHAHTVLYQVDPGATLEEHLVALSPRGAVRELGRLRRAARGCAGFGFTAAAGKLKMRRTRSAEVPSLQADGWTAVYTAEARGMRVEFGVVAARVGGVVVILAQPKLVTGRAGRTTEAIARVAVAKVRKALRGGSPPPSGP